VLDVGLAFILRAIETYEQCAYNTAQTLAEALELHDVAEILQTSARDKENMDQSFTVLSEDMIDATQLTPSAVSPPISSTQPRGVI
jgi:ferritin-like metal-binding protein YciE